MCGEFAVLCAIIDELRAEDEKMWSCNSVSVLADGHLHLQYFVNYEQLCGVGNARCLCKVHAK